MGPEDVSLHEYVDRMMAAFQDQLDRRFASVEREIALATEKGSKAVDSAHSEHEAYESRIRTLEESWSNFRGKAWAISSTVSILMVLINLLIILLVGHLSK